MKFTPSQTKYPVLAAGLLGMALRAVLYATGLDGKGLLVSGHWAEISLWLLTALTSVWILFSTRHLTAPEEPAEAFPASPAAALGALAAAAAMAATALRDLTDGTGAMPPMACFLALAAAGCLAFSAFCRLTGRRTNFLLHVVICLALTMRMVCLYRYWRSDPQLQDYCFYMGAYIALMLAFYEHAAYGCGMGNPRKLWRLSLAAVYLCCLSVHGSPAPLLLLCCAAWALTNCPNLMPRHRRIRPQLKLEEDTP